MMDTNRNYKHVELEIIGTQNPINIQMSNFTNIIGLELEQFYYKPNGTAPTTLLGVKASGTRGRYNENGLQTEVIKTLPLISGMYTYTDNNGDDDAVKYMNNGTNLIVSFIDRNSVSLNPVMLTFDNNYLLNISLLVEE